MAKHSYIRVIGKAGPCALLLGALALPATALSQTNQIDGQINSDPESTPPAWRPGSDSPMGGMGGFMGHRQQPGGAMNPPASGGPMGGMGGFMGYRQQPGGHNAPGYGPGMGNGPHGPSPFDTPPSEYAADSGGYGDAMKSAPSAYTPSFGSGASPNPGQGMFPQFPAPRPCGGKPFMGRGGMGHGGMGRSGMGQDGMRAGADISRLLQIPGLSDEQREKLYTILDQLRRANWDLMGKKMDHSAELRKLYGAEEQDAKAIGAVYGKIFDIKRKMIEGSIEAKQKARAVLTEEQRRQLQSW